MSNPLSWFPARKTYRTMLVSKAAKKRLRSGKRFSSGARAYMEIASVTWPRDIAAETDWNPSSRSCSAVKG